DKRGTCLWGQHEHSPATARGDLYTCIETTCIRICATPDVPGCNVRLGGPKTTINQASLNSAALRQANVARAALLPRVLRCSPRYSPAAIQMFLATRSTWICKRNRRRQSYVPT